MKVTSPSAILNSIAEYPLMTKAAFSGGHRIALSTSRDGVAML